MTRGWPLFLAICLLAVMPMLYPPAGGYAVAGLFAGMLVTSLRIKRVTTPERRGVKGGSA